MKQFTKELLDELWVVKDKELAANITNTNFQYYLGNMKKKEYDLTKEHQLGFYLGWRHLYYTLVEELEKQNI
jgi:hypothetical protein